MGSKKSGFTLAEVLATLVVIGVIAALTVPALLQDIQKKELRTQWKSAYSIVEQANKRALMDYGGNFADIFQGSTDMRNKLKGYFSYVKQCATGQSEGNCWPINFYSKNGSPVSLTDVSGLILNNGMFIRFWMDTTNGSSSCAETIYYNEPSECGMYELDVNGFKGPNRYGEDIYVIHILSNTLKPAGATGSQYTCTPGGGLGCGAIYLRQ